MLESIIKTLNSIEVSGKDNMAKLLGVIYALEDISKKISNKSDEVEDGE